MLPEPAAGAPNSAVSNVPTQMNVIALVAASSLKRPRPEKRTLTRSSRMPVSAANSNRIYLPLSDPLPRLSFDL